MARRVLLCGLVRPGPRPPPLATAAVGTGACSNSAYGLIEKNKGFLSSRVFVRCSAFFTACS